MQKVFPSFAVYAFLLGVAFTGCQRGCSVSREIDRTSEKRKISKHQVNISCSKFEQTTTYLRGIFRKRNAHIDRSRSYYVNFSVTIDDRPTIADINHIYLDSENETSTASMVKAFDIEFSEDDSHFRTSVNKEDYQTFHMLTSGRPFALRFMEPENNPWSAISMEKLAPADKMVQYLIREELLNGLDYGSEDALAEALRILPAPSQFDTALVKHLCWTRLGPKVLTAQRIQTCYKNKTWRAIAESVCRDTSNIIDCSTWYFTLIAYTADAEMLKWYDQRFFEHTYILERLNSKRDETRYRKELLKKLHAEIDPFVDSGFTFSSSSAENVFSFVHRLKDQSLTDKLYLSIIHTSDFDEISSSVRGQVFEGFSKKRQKAIMAHAIGTFRVNPKENWVTWSFITQHATCDEINKLRESDPVIAKEYSMPMQCDENWR